jgi:hypothetical protein
MQTKGKVTSSPPPFEAVVVVHPMWEANEASVALLTRHVQHYAMLGFTR